MLNFLSLLQLKHSFGSFNLVQILYPISEKHILYM